MKVWIEKSRRGVVFVHFSPPDWDDDEKIFVSGNGQGPYDASNEEASRILDFVGEVKECEVVECELVLTGNQWIAPTSPGGNCFSLRRS